MSDEERLARRHGPDERETWASTWRQALREVVVHSDEFVEALERHSKVMERLARLGRPPEEPVGPVP